MKKYFKKHRDTPLQNTQVYPTNTSLIIDSTMNNTINFKAQMPNQDETNKRNLFYQSFRSKSNRNPIRFSNNKNIE